MRLVSQLSDECERGANKTFIAMLGTALLAKATDLRADPFALKSGLGTPGAYSARSLCQHVLAAHAPRLGIDLGVTGREPLNNQPFFAEERVHDSLPVHPRAAAGFNLLLKGLERISAIDSDGEARAALRAFLRSRTEERYAGRLDLAADYSCTVSDLVEAVEEFVGSASEYGRRAQAVVAGVLDAVSSSEVAVSQVHDPDRHFPGDVNISADGLIRIPLEVRDKPVNEPDVYHFVRKVSDANVPRAGIVAIGGMHGQWSMIELQSFANSHGITLQIFGSWRDFISAASFWGDRRFEGVDVLTRIHQRSIELEVSPDGLRQWEDIVARLTRR